MDAPPAGRRLCVALLASVAVWLAACADGSTGPDPAPIPNRPPAARAPIPDREIRLADTLRLDGSSHFTDPDGDALAFSAASSDPAVAAADVAANVVTVRALARGSATITVTAADPDGLEASLSFEVTVPNSAPEARGAPPPLELRTGDSARVEVAPHFADPDGDPLAYRAESSDPTVAHGEVDGDEVTIRALARGSATITVTAADPDGLEAALSFEVTAVNGTPRGVAPLPAIEVARGGETGIDVSPHFTDPDGDALAFSAASSDAAVAAADVAANVVTVRALARGSATITVAAADPDGLEASLSFEVTVPNSAPEARGAPPPLELPTGDSARVEAAPHFADPDGDPLAYRAASSDPAVAAAEVSGSAVTIRALARGSATITVTASDPDGLEAALSFEVTAVNGTPRGVAPLPGIEVARGGEAATDASPHFTDPDGDALAFSAASSDPAVAAADVSGSVVTVRALARGSATITVAAADPDGLEASLSFQVTVPNSAPEARGAPPPLELPTGDSARVEAAPHFADPDGDALAYRAESSDPTIAHGEVDGDEVTIRALARGSATITVTASDPDGLEAALSFEVTAVNGTPRGVAPLPGIEVARGGESATDVSPHFTDPDGDALAFSAASSDPAVAAADVSGSVVTVRALARGSATITVAAADPDGLEASLSFEVTVPNSAPEARGAPPPLELPTGDSARVEAAPHFADPDGDPLAYRAESSDPTVAHGEVSGSAVTVRALARGSATITVTASDPDGLEAALSFEVTAVNGTPRGVAPLPGIEVARGGESATDVSPHFTDPDGDALAFSAASSDPAVAAADVSGSVVTVRALARGSATITVAAADPDGLEASLSFQVTVPNSAPEARGAPPPLELPTGDSARVEAAPRFADPDGDALAYRAGSSDPAVAAAEVSGSAVTVRALARGSATITVTAADPDGLEAALSFEVTAVNAAPRGVAPLPGIEFSRGGEAATDVSPHFTDPDGDALAFSTASSDPDVAAADIAASVVTVRALALGSATITVTAADPDGLEASLSFPVTVSNHAPLIVASIADIELATGGEVAVDASDHIADPDGDPLFYGADSSDPAVAATEVSGSEVTVRALVRGSATITVAASDPDGLEAALSFEVTVVNAAPRATARPPDIELSRNGSSSLTVSDYFRDPDGDPLAYDASSSDPAVAEAAVSGDLLTVTARARGTSVITISARDPAGLEGSARFEVAVSNRAPSATATLPDLALDVGAERTVVLSRYFSDPDGDALRFAATSSDPGRAEVALSGATLRVRGRSEGSARVTVRATDAPGLSATQSFGVTVTRPAPPPPPPNGFNIQLGFHSSISASARRVIEGASAAWESILSNTELPNVRILSGTISCGGLRASQVDTVDDLLILIAAISIDGPRGVLARAGPCIVRQGSHLPIVGSVIFDEADIDRIPAATGLHDLTLHEIAHVLGMGSLWSLRNPSRGAADPAAADTHFPGANAVAAFNSAGGASYTGGKVPVENGGDDAHWRTSILAGELMEPFIDIRRNSPLSAITIQALADMGYSVNAALADAYTIALPDARGPVAAEAGDMVPLGDDIARLPIQIVDAEGRVVRVIRPGDPFR